MVSPGKIRAGARVTTDAAARGRLRVPSLSRTTNLALQRAINHPTASPSGAKIAKSPNAGPRVTASFNTWSQRGGKQFISSGERQQRQGRHESTVVVADVLRDFHEPC